jgi:hypothetical protein
MLPPNMPPSHFGKICKIDYKLIIGVQRPYSEITQIVSIPFRYFSQPSADGVMPFYEILKPVILIKDLAVISDGDTPPSPLSSIKVLIIAIVKDPELDFINNTLDNINLKLQKSKKVVYDICKDNEHICQISLPRNSYKLGEIITITLNFSKSLIACHNVLKTN